MVTKHTIYRSADGQSFDNEVDAINHEVYTAILDNLIEFIEENCSPKWNCSDEIADCLLKHYDMKRKQ